jgi:hypothetical protein
VLAAAFVRLRVVLSPPAVYAHRNIRLHDDEQSILSDGLWNPALACCVVVAHPAIPNSMRTATDKNRIDMVSPLLPCRSVGDQAIVIGEFEARADAFHGEGR